MIDIIVSIVVYKTPKSQIDSVIKSFLNESNLKNIEIYIFDNGLDLELKEYCLAQGFNYLTVNKNIGFSAGHNCILGSTVGRGISYLILNPDLYIGSGALNSLYDFLCAHSDCGAVSPKILNLDHSIQYVCRLLPTPTDLLARRFFPRCFKSYLDRTELRFTNYMQTFQVPFIHGACLLIRGDLYESIGGFDERYFLYMEDVDICREISKTHKIFFYANVSAFHAHAKGSYKNGKLLYLHLNSAFNYFNKWGWFFDGQRKKLNTMALNNLGFKQ